MTDFDPFIHHRPAASEPARKPKSRRVTFHSKPERAGNSGYVWVGVGMVVLFIAMRDDPERPRGESEASTAVEADGCVQVAQPPVDGRHDNLWDMARRCLPQAPPSHILEVVSKEVDEREGNEVVHIGESVTFDIEP